MRCDSDETRPHTQNRRRHPRSQSSPALPASGFRLTRHAAPALENVRWWKDLPPGWRKRVVPPAEFRLFREYEVAADRMIGYEAGGLPCYCAARYRLTQLRSDDDDLFYEETVHAETLTAWRLRDDRWLIHRTIYGNDGQGTTHSFFAFGDTLPR